jgi:hypothetical protein
VRRVSDGRASADRDLATASGRQPPQSTCTRRAKPAVHEERDASTWSTLSSRGSTVRLRTGASPALEWVCPVTKGVDLGQLRATYVYCSASRTTTWRAGDQARSRHGRTGAEAGQPVHVFNIAQVREQGAEPPDVDRHRPELGGRRAEPDENAYGIGRLCRRAPGRSVVPCHDRPGRSHRHFTHELGELSS